MYSSLHNHSEFSVLDGYGHPQEYLERARSVGLNAFAITEHGNAYSWIYFDELKKNYPEIKMIYGVELYECFDMSVKDSNSKYFHLVALAKNERGRVALNEIVTQSNFEGFYFKPRIDLAHLRPYADDLIILSACLASKLARESDYGQCVQYIDEYKSAFPNFFLEMQSHNTDEQCRYNQKVLELAEATNTEFVITTDSHAATKDDLYYQARHVQIAHDDETLTELYDGCYIQSEAEIYEVMSSQIGEENVKLGLANTNKVADMIENVDMPFQAPQLPTYPLPDGFEDNLSYLKHLTEKGWKQRGFYKLNGDAQRIREKRLEYELGIIHQMGFDGYFLIVWDFIKHAKENGQAVGDGRGSGGGSIVNFLLGISELDPIENDLIFERFLNPERVSMPDIDCDFSNREFIIDYLTQKYGEDRVCQIINYSYITPIVAIKDVGKVLGIPYSVCDRISKKFTYKTFEECIENNKSLLDDYSEYNELFRIASHISGRLRNVSIHAGGVGIVDTKITDYMPMKLGSKGEHVIQVDKKKVEEIGIIKFDVLGVATLAAVQEAMEDIGLSEWDLSINNPEFANDTAMYELLASARTNGVFQVESSGMRDLLLRLKPTNLEDVSAVLALYRPDSMGALEDYIERKNGGKAITYIHPDMEPILQKTYGCLIYQEQLMDVVRKFGGRSYGGADKFRKAIGKKNIELVKEESEKLYGEIIANGYPEGIAKQISDDLKEKGGYLFNKSHSALYSILTLKTAHLKAHYPEYFFKALLNQNRNDYGVINKYIIDTKAFGVSVLPPNINRSERYFTVHNSKILFGLEAIRGVGEKVVTQILEERKANDFTKEQTYDLYMLAHDKGLKGITIFRDGCKRTGILNISNANNMEPLKEPEQLSRGVIIEANDNVIGKKRKLITGCGSLHCTAFFDPDTGELMETYLSKGSTGGCNNFMIGLSRMISLSARSGCDVHTIVDQLNSCGVCPSYAVRKATKNDTSKGSCCPIAVANALLDMYNELQEELGLMSEKRADKNSDETSIPDSDECVEQLKTSSNEICPECGEPLFFEGGCNICKNCGWSKCN